MTITARDCHADAWRRKITGKAQSWVAASRGWILIAGMLLAGFLALAGEPLAEAQSKAKFLVNFAEFTEWPQGAFSDNNELLKIGILGRDPFGKDIDELAESDLLKGRRAHILRSRKVEELKSCHILYVSQSEESRLERILRVLRGKPVLTVSEIEDSANRGVMIQMKTEDEKLRLVINLESAKAANLTLKSKLLRLGEIIEPPKK